jgi:hypothetical protein
MEINLFTKQSLNFKQGLDERMQHNNLVQQDYNKE